MFRKLCVLEEIIIFLLQTVLLKCLKKCVFFLVTIFNNQNSNTVNVQAILLLYMLETLKRLEFDLCHLF